MFKKNVKPLPDYMGVKGIRFIYFNEWSTPLVRYKRRHFYSTDMEDLLMDRYRDDGGNDEDVEAEDAYFREHALEAAEDLYQSGYYVKLTTKRI